MTNHRILIAGVGNIFFGDDAFGVEVVARLAQRPLPESVKVIDFGIRGLDLTYALLEDYEAAILVDAVSRGGPPGTLYVLEPQPGEPAGPDDGGPMIELHNLDPAKVLRLARALGGTVRRVLVVGCEPSPFDPDDLETGLSEPVRAAVEEAAPLIESLVDRFLAEGP